ncbi:MAG TPA: serine hydrolase, partial [Methylomirabilota bacterium]|nr:serine hydrolase [Methylomirabilota bacterium]
GGAAGTAFWIDPGEEMIVVFMTQIMQMGLPAPYPLRRELRTLAYSAIVE